MNQNKKVFLMAMALMLAGCATPLRFEPKLWMAKRNTIRMGQNWLFLKRRIL